MVDLPNMNIPCFPDEEIQICSDQILSESDQQAIAELISGTKADGNKMTHWNEQDLWNYHDESWTEYNYICVFRITEEVYEKNRIDSIKPGRFWPLSEIAERSRECLCKKDHEVGSIAFNNYSQDLWWDVYNYYVRDLAGVPGYLHIVLANGSDRAFVN